MTNSMPLARSSLPSVKRVMPVDGSMPTVPSMMPTRTIRAARRIDVPVTPVRISSPSTAIAKYSGGPNASAQSATVGANSVSPTRPSVPATNEPMAATASAAPARPFFAMA